MWNHSKNIASKRTVEDCHSCSKYSHWLSSFSGFVSPPYNKIPLTFLTIKIIENFWTHNIPILHESPPLEKLQKAFPPHHQDQFLPPRKTHDKCTGKAQFSISQAASHLLHRFLSLGNLCILHILDVWLQPGNLQYLIWHKRKQEC